MAEEFLFTCKECGSHVLKVSWQYSTISNYTEELECSCGQSDIAAEHEYELSRTYEGWGYIDDDHRWSQEEEEEEIHSETDDIDWNIFCHDCYENSAEDEWEIVKEETDKDDDSYEFYVNCDGCDREIEFGWSHENRGGRIWPSGCTDFNPWKSWPEPRYKEIWNKKGWLRPKRR